MGRERERAPGQVVIPRMWRRLRGVLLEAEWPLNAPRPHPQKAYRGRLLSLKTQSPSASSPFSSHSLCWVGASQGDHRLQTHLQESAGMNMQRVSKWIDICYVETRGLPQWIWMTSLQIFSLNKWDHSSAFCSQNNGLCAEYLPGPHPALQMTLELVLMPDWALPPAT